MNKISYFYESKNSEKHNVLYTTLPWFIRNHTQVVYNWKGDKLQGWYATNVTDSGVTHRVGMSGESGPMAASLSSLHIHPYVHTTDIKSNSAYMLLVQIYILELHFIGELKRGTDSLNDDEHPINTVLKSMLNPIVE